MTFLVIYWCSIVLIDVDSELNKLDYLKLWARSTTVSERRHTCFFKTFLSLPGIKVIIWRRHKLYAEKVACAKKITLLSWKIWLMVVNKQHHLKDSDHYIFVICVKKCLESAWYTQGPTYFDILCPLTSCLKECSILFLTDHILKTSAW